MRRRPPDPRRGRTRDTTRRQFGRPIGQFQATGFKLADMAVELRAADLLVMDAVEKADRGAMTDADAAMVAVLRCWTGPPIAPCRSTAAWDSWRSFRFSICRAMPGWSGSGTEGARLEAALVEAAGDLALIGPSCYGFIN